MQAWSLRARAELYMLTRVKFKICYNFKLDRHRKSAQPRNHFNFDIRLVGIVDQLDNKSYIAHINGKEP